MYMYKNCTLVISPLPPPLLSTSRTGSYQDPPTPFSSRLPRYLRSYPQQQRPCQHRPWSGERGRYDTVCPPALPPTCTHPTHHADRHPGVESPCLKHTSVSLPLKALHVTQEWV